MRPWIIVFLFMFFSVTQAQTFNSAAYAQETTKEDEAIFIAKKAFEDGFYDVCLGMLERFLKNYPSAQKIAEAHLLIGECYFHQNRYIDALTKFEWLLKQPDSKGLQDAIFYWIAEVHFKGNNYHKAAEYYAKIVDNFPKSSYSPSAYYSLGWCLLQDGKYAQALKNFKIVEDKYPKEPVAMDSAFKIVECLYNLKDYSALKDRLKGYLKTYAKDTGKIPYIYFYLAESDYYLNNFSEAIDGYLKALSMSRDEKIIGLSKLGVGWGNLKLKRYKEAQDAFADIKPETLEKPSRDVLLLGKAALALETKKYTEAQSIYEELANSTLEPITLIQAYLGKAEALYNVAEYKEAVEVYRAALNKLQDSIPQEFVDKVHYGLAWAYLKEGRFKEAIDEFQKIAKLSQDKVVKVAALCQVGDTYQDSGDFNKAMETYDLIVRDYPDSFYGDYVQYQLGLCLLKLSKYDAAIAAFQKMKNSFSNSKLMDDATYALGLAYFQREDYNSSKDVFERFQEEYKDSGLKPQAAYLLGTSLYNLGKFTEAIEVFKNIVRLYGQDLELCQKSEYEIADCYYQMGNEAEAMNRFKALRSKYPDSTLTVEVMWWLGEYYYRHRDFVLARRYFSSLIQDFPKSSLVADAYYALGSINEEDSNYTEAIENFKKVIDLGKTDMAGTAAIAIADIYVKQDQFDLALKSYQDAISGNANLAAAIYPKIADVYKRMNNYPGALEYLGKSLSVVPVREAGGIQFKMAEILQAQDKIQPAIDEYLKVAYLYTDNSDLVVKAFLRVSGIYEEKRNFKEAANIYRKITTMNVEEAKYAQGRLDWIKANVK